MNPLGTLSRRMLMVAMVVLVMTLAAKPARAEISTDWETFKTLYVLPDGRVVDTGNNGISHTEGQGVALLFAVAADDQEAFSSILGWTEANLNLDGDGLFAWEWKPNKGVADPNDAADGDILIAWALALASEKWQQPEFRTRALRTIKAIRTRLLRERGGFLVLLPGAKGFDQAKITTINLSYWLYPAFKTFQALDPDPAWTRLTTDGIRLVTEARFGPTRLPSDWVDVDDEGHVTPAAGRPPRFGFDAIRVPLYLAWGFRGDQRLVSLAAPFIDHWNNYVGKPLPAWIDVASGATAPFNASQGMEAITIAVRSTVTSEPASFPPITQQLDYYAASLILLAEMSVTATN